jgi:hypothetical protein
MFFAVLNNVLQNSMFCFRVKKVSLGVFFGLKMKAFIFFESSGTIYPTTKHNTPEDLRAFLYVNDPNLLTRSSLQSE